MDKPSLPIWWESHANKLKLLLSNRRNLIGALLQTFLAVIITFENFRTRCKSEIITFYWFHAERIGNLTSFGKNMETKNCTGDALRSKILSLATVCVFLDNSSTIIFLPLIMSRSKCGHFIFCKFWVAGVQETTRPWERFYCCKCRCC